MSNHRKKRKKSDRPDVDFPPPDAVVSLTPQGRVFLEQLLDALSAEAGRRMTANDVHEVLQKVKAETGKPDVSFNDPQDMECFLKHLRALRLQ